LFPFHPIYHSAETWWFLNYGVPTYPPESH